MAADPPAWGYQISGSAGPNTSSPVLVPVQDDGFRLHFIGKAEANHPLDIPPSLRGEAPIVGIHPDTEHSEFYRSISMMVRVWHCPG